MREYESPSSCYTYDHCPQKYKFRYIDKLPDPAGAAAELGKRFEDLVYPRWNFDRQWQHEDPRMSGMLEALFGDDRVKKLPAHRTIQQKIDVPCGKIRLLGYMDMLHTDNSITDIKTSKSLWTNQKLSETQQHIAYPYGAMKAGFIPNTFPVLFRYLIVTTGLMAKVQIIEVLITEEDFVRYERGFIERANRISLEVFPPKKTYECNWCPYKRICPAWQTQGALFAVPAVDF